jgi:ABC-type branched-subunit amino acid transport system substrate-binding protein
MASAQPGVSPQQIVLGTHAPLRGPAARFSAAARAAGAYFQWINDQGGIHGRQIRWIVRDDRHDAAGGEQAARELVRQDRVFAVVGALGDIPHGRAAALLGRDEVPDLFVLGGAPHWDRPVPRSAFALRPSYRQEGALLAQVALRELAGRRLAIYAQHSALGSESAQGFREGLRGRATLAGEAHQSVSEGDPAPVIAELRGTGAQAVALFAVPGMVGRFIEAAAKAGWTPRYLLASDAAVPELFGWAGRRELEGALSLAWLPSAQDMRDARIARHREILARYAPGLKADALTVAGQAAAELTVEALRRAGPALTRDGLVKAVESLRNWNDDGKALVPMVSLSAQDHQALHSARVLTARDGRWVTSGDWLAVPALEP